MVHTVAFLWFLRVWLWHLTPAASVLPGAQGWGWFVRFLTFYSYTLQTFTLGLAAADDWSKLVRLLLFDMQSTGWVGDCVPRRGGIHLDPGKLLVWRFGDGWPVTWADALLASVSSTGSWDPCA